MGVVADGWWWQHHTVTQHGHHGSCFDPQLSSEDFVENCQKNSIKIF